MILPGTIRVAELRRQGLLAEVARDRRDAHDPAVRQEPGPVRSVLRRRRGADSVGAPHGTEPRASCLWPNERGKAMQPDVFRVAMVEVALRVQPPSPWRDDRGPGWGIVRRVAEA